MFMSMTSPKHFVYVLKCGDMSLYCGYTVDLERRLAQHRRREGAKYTRPYKRHPLCLVAAWEFSSSHEAKRTEYLFKQLTRTQKIALVYSDLNLYKGLRVKIKTEV